MTTPATQILITNLTSGNLSIDARADKFSDKVLRTTLGPAGSVTKPLPSVDAAALGWALDELNANAQILALLNHTDPVTGLKTPRITVTLVKGADIPGVNDSVANAGGAVDVFRQSFHIPAGAGGAPDDVTLFNANFPFLAEITDAQFNCDTFIALSTVQARTLAGGAGSPLTDAFSTVSVGRKRDASVALVGVDPVVPVGGSIFVRRSDSGVAGTISFDFKRLA